VKLARSPKDSTVPGLRRGKQELAAGTLTPLILVRIQVPQPRISCKVTRGGVYRVGFHTAQSFRSLAQ
jgi:hypothetical protein